MSEKDGGPAFPFEYHNQTRQHQKSFATDDLIAPDGAEQYAGMSLRDYFAGQALVGLIAAGPHDCEAAGVAHDAYLFADAMLSARAALSAARGEG